MLWWERGQHKKDILIVLSHAFLVQERLTALTFICSARQDEGTAAVGYTLGEACVLARSSVGGQRAAALHILTAVLAQVTNLARSRQDFESHRA